MFIAGWTICFVLQVSAQKKIETVYSDPMQLDSSEWFMIPVFIDREEESEGLSKVAGWGDYRDIIFYNQRTKETKKLFGDKLAIVEAFRTARYSYNNGEPAQPSKNTLPNHLVFLARTDNYNEDRVIGYEDPVYLYTCSRSGDNLKQVTPAGVHVLSWTVSKDNKMILVKALNDKSGNKKFGKGDEQVYYRIDLDDDVSKIQCYPVAL